MLIRSITAAAVAGALTFSSAYAQTASHPDFSGLWFPNGRSQTPNPAPYTEAAQKLADEYNASQSKVEVARKLAARIAGHFG